MPTTTLAPKRTPARALRRRGLFLHELRSLAQLAGPIIVSQLGQVGMSTADTIMVGPLGAVPLAAAGIGSAIYMFLAFLFSGLLMGMSPLVSQAYGAGNREQCRRVFVQGLWLALAMSVPLMLACWSGGTIARLLGQPPEVAALAGEYLNALAWSGLPLLVFFAARQFLEGMSIVRAVTAITLGGLVVNIAANQVLIHGLGPVPALGVVGSGYATTIVRWTMLLAAVVYVARRSDLHPFRGIGHRPVRPLLSEITRVGWPIGLQIGMEVGIFTLAAVAMGWLGPVELAAHQVTLNLAATTFMVALGASLAGTVRVGQHLGAGRTRAVKRATAATYVVAVGFMALCAILFLAVPEPLVGLYSSDPEIVRRGVELLLFAAIFQVFDGAQVAGVSVLRGAADTRTPMLVAGVGYWGVAAPVGYLLAFRGGFGPAGIWAGLTLGLAVVAIVLFWRVRAMVARL